MGPSWIVAVGASLGGMHALQVLLAALPPDFGPPVIVVQHRHHESREALGDVLRRSSALSIREPEDKTEIASGSVWLAPADYHLLVDGGRFALSTEAPVGHARPSIDVFFESAAEAFGPRVVGVVLTGASRDGAKGLARIKRGGGLALVQDPATAECPVMPRAAIAACPVDGVLALPEIAAFLARLPAAPVEA